jgi:hypothetical protein
MTSASERKKKRYAEDPEYREKEHARQRAWRAKNPERFRRSRIKSLYGASVDYDALFAQQGGVCRVCRKSFEERLCIDHNHRTGRVRGLLCRGCNWGLGNFKEDPKAMRAAADLMEEDQAYEQALAGGRPPVSPIAPAVPRPTPLAGCGKTILEDTHEQH